MEENKKTETIEATSEEKETTESSLLKRLEKMEALLEEQTKQSKKAGRVSMVLSSLLVCFVLVFTIGIYTLNRTLASATQDLPELITTATTSAEEIQKVAENMNSMDFETLNQSIEDLKKVAESLANMTRVFR